MSVGLIMREDVMRYTDAGPDATTHGIDTGTGRPQNGKLCII